MTVCGCDYDGDTFRDTADDFSRMPKRSRRCRCASCKKMLNEGDTVLALRCFRQPRCDIEERLYVDEVPLATKYLCERCGEILMNLESAGNCVLLDGNLEGDLRQYWDMTDFDPAKYQEGK